MSRVDELVSFSTPLAKSVLDMVGNTPIVQLDGAPKSFCGSVGNGSMIVGISQELKPHRTRVFALEPAG